MMSRGAQLRVVLASHVADLPRLHPAASSLLSARESKIYAEFAGGGSSFPLLFYLEENGQVRSYLRCIPDEVTVDGGTHRWAWTADNFTRPEARGRGLSTLLQREATTYLHAQDIGRGSVFSTDVTLHIFEKLGFSIAGYAPRFLLLRSARPLLDAHVASPVPRRVLSAIASPAVAAGAVMLSRWNRLLVHGTSWSTPDDFPQRTLCELADTLAGRRVSFSTSPDQLRRKLQMAERAGRHTLYLIHDRASSSCLAYLVLRERLQERPLAGRYRNFRLMTLVDFGLADGDRRAAAGIVSAVVRRFFDSDAEVLELVSSHPLVNREAVRRGLRAAGRGMSFNFAVPAEWRWPEDLRDPRVWPLTHFCGDGFSY